MAVPQRCEPETFVVAGIGRIAHADHRIVQQPDDGSDDALERKATPSQIGIDLRSQARQCLGECDKAGIFLSIPLDRPVRMIAILLAALEVAARRQDVAVGVGRNPDIRPCRRNGEGANTPQALALAQPFAAGPDIPEASWRALAAYPRLGIADIGKLGTFRSLLVAVPRRLFCEIACAAGKLVQHAGSMAFGHDKPGSGDRFPATRLLYRVTGPAPRRASEGDCL